MAGIVHQNVCQHGPTVSDRVHLQVVVLVGTHEISSRMRSSTWTDSQDSHNLKSVSDLIDYSVDALFEAAMSYQGFPIQDQFEWWHRGSLQL
jgi:hypothetical protein